MLPDPFARARRVLVMRTDNIGDVVLAGPLLRALRAHLPTAHIGLLASPAGAKAAPLLPWIDEVVESRPLWQDLGGRLPFDPERELGFIAAVRDGAWDATVIATSFRQTAWAPAYAAYLAGIPVRIGFAPDFGGSVLSHPVPPPDPALHQALRNLELLERLGIATGSADLELELPEPAVARAREVVARVGALPGEPIVVVPGASAPARRMAPQRFGAAAAVAARESGRPVIVVGTARERSLVEAVVQTCPGGASVTGELTVPEFAAVVAAAGGVLCGNSAALHVADAFARPLVAAYGGTDLASQWEPRRSRASLASVPVACSPCYRIECPIDHPCMDLDPEVLGRRLVGLMEPASPRTSTPRREEVRCVA
jgi:ADP-heptose:LPS heptosyltransferase